MNTWLASDAIASTREETRSVSLGGTGRSMAEVEKDIVDDRRLFDFAPLHGTAANNKV
jgi:hypothetical protein